MNSPAQQPRSSNYAMMTLIVAVVCGVSLVAAGFGMINDQTTRLKVCKLIYNQMVSVHNMANNSPGLMKKKEKQDLGQNLGKFHKVLLKHCPPEFDDPPKPKKPAEQLGDVIKNLMME